MVVWMIDIHTHVLPYIDDGAKDNLEAIKMTECMEQQGVQMAICTPHFDSTKQSMEDFLLKREEAILAMKNSKIPLISGSETLYSYILFQYSDLDQICINNTRYLLLELPYKDDRKNLDLEPIENLINLFNIIPIIAHIERYNFLWKNKNNIKRLMNLACVMQVNANTIIHKKHRKTALNYIKKGFIDVIGSDCHNIIKRPPNLKDAFVIIENEIGISYSAQLKNNAESISRGIKLRNDAARIMLKEVNYK